MKASWFFIIPLLLLLTGLASMGLDADPIDNGEFHSFGHTGGFSDSFSLLETAQHVAKTSEQHVPFYFFLLNLWVKLTGTSTVMMRMVALFSGVITVALGYRLATTLVSRQMGLISAFLIATSMYFIYYMHEIRMYSMLPGLVIILYWVYWNIMSSSKAPRLINLIALYCITTALIYTHYFGIFGILSIGIYHLFAKKDKRWFQVVVVMIFAGITFLPWLPIFIEGFTYRKDLGDTNQSTIELFYSLLDIYTNHFVVLGLVYAFALFHIIRSRQKSIIYLMTIIMMPVIITLLINNLTPLLPQRRMRYSFVLMPSFILLLSYGFYLLYRWRKIVFGVVMIGWIGAGINFSTSPLLLTYSNRLSKESDVYPAFHLITRFISEHQKLPDPEPLFTMKSGENIVGSIVEYYGGLIDNTFIHIQETTIQTILNRVDLDSFAIIIDFEEELAFWLAYRPGYDLASNTIYQNILTEYHKSCGVREFNDDMVIEYYLVKDVPCEIIDAPFRVKYQTDAIVLTHFYPIVDDQILRLYSIWERASTKSAFPYSISFQIFDVNGNKVAQQDHIAPFEPIDTKAIDISHLDGGTYSLTLTLYDPETGFINQGSTQNSEDLKNNVILSEFTIK